MLHYCDDESLLWSDAFGLSRLASSRIKTLPQGSAHPFSTLSLDQHAMTAMLYDAVRQEATFYEYPALERKKRLTDLPALLELRYPVERTSVLLHPQGNALLVWQDEPYNDEGTMGLLAYNDETDQEAFYPLDFEAIPSDPKERLHLGPLCTEALLSQAPLCSPFSIAKDGQFVAYSQRARLLFGGFWATAGAPPTLLWKLPLTLHPRCQASITTQSSGSLVAVYDQSRYLLYTLHVDPYGGYKQRQLPARGLPAFYEETLAYQRDVETLVRVDLQTQEIEETTLPPQIVGDGRLMLGPGQLFFAPMHGEILYDVDRKKIRQRRLPEADKPLRHLFEQRIQEYEKIGRVGRMIVVLDHMQRKDRKEGPALHYHLTAMGESDRLLSAFSFYHFSQDALHVLPSQLQAHKITLEETGILTYESSDRSLVESLEHTLPTEEQHEVFRHLDRHNFDLRRFAPFLQDLHDARMGYDYTGASVRLKEVGAPLFSTEDQMRWLHLLCLSILDSPKALQFALSTQEPPCKTLALYQEQLFATLEQADPTRASEHLGIILRLCLEAFGAPSFGLFIALLREPPHSFPAASYFGLGVMALRCARQHPETTLPLLDAFSQWTEACEDQDALWTIKQIVQAPEKLKKLLKRR